MRIDNVLKLIAVAIYMTSATSCVDSQLNNALSKVDDILECRNKIYEEYEISLQRWKDSLAVADCDSLRWVYAEKLHNCYQHFSMDSTFFYINIQKNNITDPKQEYRTIFNKVTALTLSHDEFIADELFASIDTSQVAAVGLMKEYWACGMILYNYMLNHNTAVSKEDIRLKVNDFRNKYIRTDSVSFAGRRYLALKARDEGDYDRALKILAETVVPEDDYHKRASIAYNMAKLYSRMGDWENCVYSLIASIENDFKCPVRDYMSLYYLAVKLYDGGYHDRAEKYISANLIDALSGNFSTRVIGSSKFQVIVSEVSKRKNQRMNNFVAIFIVSLVVMIVLLCRLLVVNRKYFLRIKRTKDSLQEINRRLKKLNKELHYANRIKDSYVFRYMELSIHYLEMIEETRKEIRTAGKTGGIEQVMKMLRSPSVMYDEYNKYYKIFDEAFLDIFPNFVQDVNKLLREDARFPMTDEKTLSTELRLLAVIRLGITESGKIATFLNCAPTTIYTYRTRLKRAALCDKDIFEAEVMKC